MLVIAAPGLLRSQTSAQRSEYYRSENAFKRGIELFPFEVHENHYLKVEYNNRDFVSAMHWYSQADSLLRSRTYTYWPDDMSVQRMLDFTPDSLIQRELLFGDEPKSRELIGYVYGVDYVSDFRDRFTEVIYDSSQAIVAYKIMATQGQLIAAIFLDYDSLGFLTNETWFQGAGLQRVREFRYIFHRETGQQEVIERGRDGQVVSHVRIKLDPHRRPSFGWRKRQQVMPLSLSEARKGTPCGQLSAIAPPSPGHPIVTPQGCPILPRSPRGKGPAGWPIAPLARARWQAPGKS